MLLVVLLGACCTNDDEIVRFEATCVEPEVVSTWL